MKRIKQIDGRDIYDLICDEENIEDAIKKACKDHAKDPAVIRIKQDPEPYIKAIKQILEDQSFHYSKFKHKTITERGKQRNLCFTRTFPDRIIQHTVFNIIAPILHATIIPTEFAAVKGRGTHACAMKVFKDMCDDRSHTKYALKIDVHHFFDSIDRDILFDLIKRKIKCSRTLDILHRIIFDVPGDKGLPIGLYSSQILSVFYLSPLDHYCKQVLGQKYYYRYMDDIVILSGNKNILHNCLRYIKFFLKKDLNLTLKKNHAIFPTMKRRLDFVGYVFSHFGVMIRKRNKISYIRVCKSIIRHMQTPGHKITTHMLMSRISYEGMLTWCTDCALMKKYGGCADIAMEFGQYLRVLSSSQNTSARAKFHRTSFCRRFVCT